MNAEKTVNLGQIDVNIWNLQKEITLTGTEIDLVICALGTVITDIICNDELSFEERNSRFEFWDNFRTKIQSR
jgi:hypothetical protein